MSPLQQLLQEVRACRLCEAHLPLGPRPVLRADERARVLIVGQAPGTRVHATGIPWNDPSGDRLRQWLAVDRDTFYEERRFAIIPTAFCYPGRGRSGDLPPRPECAPLWHPRLRALLPGIRLTLLVGQYAQAYYLGIRCKATLTRTVHAWLANTCPNSCPCRTRRRETRAGCESIRGSSVTWFPKCASECTRFRSGFPRLP